MMAKPPKFKMGDKVFVVIAEERIAGTISVAPKTAGEKQVLCRFRRRRARSVGVLSTRRGVENCFEG